MKAIEGVSALFKQFVYVREWVGDRDMALEFECRLGDGPNALTFHGVDLIKINDEGKISEFAVVGRPPKAVQVLLEHQTKYLKEFLAQMGGGKAKM